MEKELIEQIFNGGACQICATEFPEGESGFARTCRTCLDDVKRKTYAICFENGQTKKVFTWEQCQKLTRGISKVKYKSFNSEEEADNWLKEVSNNNVIPECDIHVYVDGSFSDANKHAGWGWVATKDGEMIAEDCGITNNPAESRQIDGELSASMRALLWWNQPHIKSKYPKICIHYDYIGIACWINGEWNANSEVAKKYVSYMKKFPLFNKVFFKHVKGHSDNKWNDRADELASSCLK